MARRADYETFFRVRLSSLRKHQGRLWFKDPNRKARLRTTAEFTLMRKFTNAESLFYKGHAVWVEELETHDGNTALFAFVAYPNHPYQTPGAFLLSPNRLPGREGNIFPDNKLCIAKAHTTDPRNTVLVVRNWAAAFLTSART